VAVSASVPDAIYHAPTSHAASHARTQVKRAAGKPHDARSASGRVEDARHVRPHPRALSKLVEDSEEAKSVGRASVDAIAHDAFIAADRAAGVNGVAGVEEALHNSANVRTKRTGTEEAYSPHVTTLP